jgi:hypothetical protein
VDRIFYGEPSSYRASLFDIKVIVAIMRVLMVKLLWHARGDGIDFSTRVPAARRTWASLVTPCLVGH